jgi:hypothetical protein
MAAASALGRDASILSPLSQAFGADETREQEPIVRRRLLRQGNAVVCGLADVALGSREMKIVPGG